MPCINIIQLFASPSSEEVHLSNKRNHKSSEKYKI